VRNPIHTVAIIGGGPAGASLAVYLARAGKRVALFDAGHALPLVIGESLVPATVPFLRRLGIEEEVASYSVFKPGASFSLPRGEEQMHFRFNEVRKATTTYAYNVPRHRMDASVRAAAVRAGARLFPLRGRIERNGAGDRLRLSADTLEKTGGFLAEQPDLLVDATGRARTVARLLDLPTETGPRRDTALHAHLENVGLEREGHVHTDILERGWSWRIPLPGRVSVGLVMPSQFIAGFGDSTEEQLDAYLRHDPVARAWAGDAKRITPVVKYTNYQLRTLRGFGENWALVGDAFGFVDPVFSSGLLVGLDSAWELARAIDRGSERAFARYQRHVLRHLRNWQRAVGHFYDGRLFTLFRVGNIARTTLPGRLFDPHFSTHIPRVFTGEATTRRYSVGLLDFMCEHGLVGNDPAPLRVG
jgi:flavin-dependent dehydrogenase